MDRPEITIIIPVRDEEATIARAIGSVLAQNAGTSFEVVVADGGSGDGTRLTLERLARADRRVRIVTNPPGTTANGLNLALAAARGRYWIRVDGHSQVPRDYAERLVAHLRSGRAEAAGAVVRGLGETPFGRAVALAHDSHFGIGDSPHHHARQLRFVDHVSHGATASTSRATSAASKRPWYATRTTTSTIGTAWPAGASCSTRASHSGDVFAKRLER